MKLRKMMMGLGALVLAVSCQLVVAQATSMPENVSVPLSKAPRGIKIDNYFKVPDESDGIANNSAKIADTDYGDQQAVQLTDANKTGGELGLIWTSDGAEMDLSQNQTASMWLYTGNEMSSSGDGMTFVMQNDPRKLGASAINTSDSANPTPATGETLGVWGDDYDNEKFTTPESLAATGIQNSWALEFDTFLNNNLPDIPDNSSAGNTVWKNYFQDLANSGNQFDVGMKGMHIASGYPGAAQSYDVVTQAFNWTDYESWDILHLNGTPQSASYHYAKLLHDGAIDTGNILLGRGVWQHITLNWDAAASKMTYTFDDKDPNTGAAKTGTSRTVAVNKKLLGLTEDNQKIRWGFTGTTGGNFENNLVVFEQVPGLVSANATAKLTDETKNQTIDDASDEVNAGDRMHLDYNLTYTGGRESWKSIQAKLNLPSQIKFSSAQISYANGDSQTISGLDSDSVDGQTISAALNQELSSTNASATISFTGKAVAGSDSETTVAATNSSFTGANAITQATLNGFKVEKNDDAAMTLSLTGEGVDATGTLGSQKLTKPADVAVTGKITYTVGIADTNSNLTLYPTLNGTPLPTQTLSNNDAAGTFTYKLTASQLLSGQDNKLTLYATDSKGHSTNDVGYTVTLSPGTRELAVGTRSTFNADNPVDMTGTAMTLQPDHNWDVTVNDTKGKGDKWTLTAAATPFISKLRGSLSAHLDYVTSDGSVSNLQAGAAEIMTHTAASDDDVLNVADDWSDTQGLLLKVNSDATQGAYYSTVTWTLGDAPA
ncbi:L-type lectin family protein [Levilactobacillus suantsaiihabitans]|uniref:WxL domain-containing protein n=1 Tax=Levilactobacillus suantsaiihabitans TaxID=2487722 RepID=A0A4Z0JAS8_9LACO|nr:hypothetical protein [Levilactobacillus suantsaiihabitans]TGD18225.1 hypothetical protein EGT51_09310 [Levilactobacillus suantsaiihabitans]